MSAGSLILAGAGLGMIGGTLLYLAATMGEARSLIGGGILAAILTAVIFMALFVGGCSAPPKIYCPRDNSQIPVWALDKIMFADLSNYER